MLTTDEELEEDVETNRRLDALVKSVLGDEEKLEAHFRKQDERIIAQPCLPLPTGVNEAEMQEALALKRMELEHAWEQYSKEYSNNPWVLSTLKRNYIESELCKARKRYCALRTRKHFLAVLQAAKKVADLTEVQTVLF